MNKKPIFLLCTIAGLFFGAQMVSGQAVLNYQTVFDMPLVGRDYPAGNITDWGAGDLNQGRNNVRNARINFHSTAICLRINWDDIATGPGPDDRDFTTLDRALDNICNEGLNIFIRFLMDCQGLPAWAQPGRGVFTNDDFMADQNGSLVLGDPWIVPYNQGPQFSYSNIQTRQILLQHYRAIMTHIINHLRNRSDLNRLIVITPVFTNQEEMEYPITENGEGAGFEDAAILRFVQFLRDRYDDNIVNLNVAWGGSFTNWNQIQPQTATWHWNDQSYLSPAYQFLVGRQDWMKFRQVILKEFVDAFALETHALGNPNEEIRFGMRFGSIHDQNMEMRGFYDITSFGEHIDWLHVAVTVEQESKHRIHADYIRSVCNYWSMRTGRPIRFSEESNWPGYGGHSAARLCAGWNTEIADFRQRGSSAHFMMNWEGVVNNAATINAYQIYINNLDLIDGVPITPVPQSDRALHISEARMEVSALFGAQHCFFPEEDPGAVVEPLADKENRDMLPEPGFTNQVYDPNGLMTDFLTDFIINESRKDAASLQYINNYTGGIFLPRGSYHIAVATLENLLNENLTAPIVNATHFNNGYGQFFTTPGRAYFAGQATPEVARLIWRTRLDIWPFWPAPVGLPVSGRANDPAIGNTSYIDWLVLVDQASPEYPELATTFANWNNDVSTVWQSRPDLQGIFTNGFHGTGAWTGRNLLHWLVENGVTEYSAELGKYANWPYSVNPAPEALEVRMLDEGFHEGNIIKPRFYIANNGTTPLSNFVMRYYFTVEPGQTPQCDVYWLPHCNVTLQNINGNDWCALFNFSGYTLQPGARVPDNSGQIVGIHNTDWTPWVKGDDFSQPSSHDYQITRKVAVTNSTGNIVYYGSRPFWLP